MEHSSGDKVINTHSIAERSEGVGEVSGTTIRTSTTTTDSTTLIKVAIIRDSTVVIIDVTSKFNKPKFFNFHISTIKSAIINITSTHVTTSTVSNIAVILFFFTIYDQ